MAQLRVEGISKSFDGEPVIREPYFRGWRIKHDFKALARTAWEQLAAEINGAPKRERNIVREIETIQ